MSCRKWVVRGLVSLVLAGCVSAGAVYQQWTNPAAVRQQVVDMLAQQFPGAIVTLESARLHLFGDVVLTDLHLMRRGPNEGEGSSSDVAYFPQATVYIDKEGLPEVVAILRIEMFRPLVTIVRNKDGKWNVEGLTGHADSTSPLPTVVIQQGTLVIEDKFTNTATWVLHDVNLKLVNDAANCLTFAGKGQSETLGTIEIGGIWNRANNATKLSFTTTGLAINKELVQYVGNHVADERLVGLELEGRADLRADVTYLPGATPALKSDVHLLLRQAKVSHPQLPVPLHNLTASLHYADNKLTLEKLKAAAGSGKVECKGWVDLADSEGTYACELTAHHLPLTKDLIERLPKRAEIVRKLFDQFKPVGAAKIQYVVEKQHGVDVRNNCTLEPDNISICFESFKYPIDRLTGFIQSDVLQNTTKFEATGFSGAQPISLHGTWQGAGLKADATIEIACKDLPLDKKLLDALKLNYQTMAKKFHPTGKGDFHGVIRRRPGSTDFQNTFELHFSDCCVKWDTFPYPLENVHGDLIIYPCPRGGEQQYEFRDFHGTHNGGEVVVCGKTLPPVDGKNEGKLVLSIAGQNLSLDHDLKEALAKSPYPKMSKIWDTFAPAGRFSFGADVEQIVNQPSYDMDLGVRVTGCALKPKFFPYALEAVSCEFRFHKDKLTIDNFTAAHYATKLSILKTEVDLFKHTDGSDDDVYAVLDDLVISPAVADADFLMALPEELRSKFKAVHLEGQSFALKANKIVVSHEPGKRPETDIYWKDTQLWVRDANLRAGIDLKNVTGSLVCEGRYKGKMVGLNGNLFLQKATVFGQPFHDVRCHYLVDGEHPDVTVFNLNAPIFGGSISGRGRFESTSTSHYQMDLTASNIQLDEFGLHNLGPKHQLAGIGVAQLHLEGKGADVDELKGEGTIDVPYSATSRLLNLPLLLDLLKFLKLRGPDGTLFEEAHAAFAIHGNRVQISKLDLQGTAISLYGRGEVDIKTNDLKLDMYPSWGRAEQALPSVVKTVPSAISKQLLKIEVRGKVGGKEGDLKFTKRPVPGIMDPLMQMGNRMLGRPDDN